MPEEQQRWYAIKIFERDDKVLEKLRIPADVMAHIEEDIKAAEKELDDDAESIITNERYVYIASIIKGCYKKKNKGGLSASDKIDKIVTNRWLGLPIFAVVMFLVYWVAMVAVGAPATDWANDGVFGDGWHLFGIGSAVDLLKALSNIYSRGGRMAEPEELTQAVPKRIVYSVRDKSRQIIDLLRRGSVYLTELYSTCRSRSEVVATFISVLELCSMGSIHIDRADEGYSLSFTGGDVNEIIEKIVE